MIVVCTYVFTTAGLGVSEFGYRMFVILVSVVSCMHRSIDPVYGFGV